MGGQDFPSTWVRHTPFPDLSLFPFWKGTRVPDVSARWVASLRNFQVGLCWGLYFAWMLASKRMGEGLRLATGDLRVQASGKVRLVMTTRHSLR